MKTVQLQVSISFDEATISTLADLFAPAILQAVRQSSISVDYRQEARTLASRNAIYGSQKPPEDQSLLVDSREVARLLKVSTRKLWDLQNSGGMPPPVRIGRAVRWNMDVLKQWIADGCPAERQ